MISRRQPESYPEPTKREILAVRSWPSPALGRFASTILPGLAVGEVGGPSLRLIGAIRRVLQERELAA